MAVKTTRRVAAATTPANVTVNLARGSTITRNDKPDARYYRPVPWAKHPYRGYIIEWLPAAGVKGPGRVDFFYNPTQLGYTYMINEAATPPDSNAPAVTTNGMYTGGSLDGVGLIFMRHFEVMNGDMMGVNRDLHALEYLIGIDDRWMEGYGYLKTLMFVFGADASMTYFGAITSMSATLSAFSENMVPMLAEVNISVSWRPQAAGQGGSPVGTVVGYTPEGRTITSVPTPYGPGYRTSGLPNTANIL